MAYPLCVYSEMKKGLQLYMSSNQTRESDPLTELAGRTGSEEQAEVRTEDY